MNQALDHLLMQVNINHHENGTRTNMPAVIFDCESTGLENARIIEAGWIETDIEADGQLLFGMPYVARFNPGKPSDLGALNIHHILDHEVLDYPDYTTFALPEHTKYVIGQNVDYDMKVIGDPQQYKRICTVGMARKLWPEADSHSLGPMMYHVFGRSESTRDLLKTAHSAIGDCRMTFLLLQEILIKTGITNLEDLFNYSQMCKLTTVRMPFGKYKGQYLADLLKTNPGYLEWLTDQPDMDEHIKSAAAELLLKSI